MYIVCLKPLNALLRILANTVQHVEKCIECASSSTLLISLKNIKITSIGDASHAADCKRFKYVHILPVRRSESWTLLPLYSSKAFGNSSMYQGYAAMMVSAEPSIKAGKKPSRKMYGEECIHTWLADL